MRTQARKKSRELPGKDREEQAALLVAALGLDGVVLRPKGSVGARGSKNWPVVGFTLTGAAEDAGASNLDEDEVEASGSHADDAAAMSDGVEASGSDTDGAAVVESSGSDADDAAAMEVSDGVEASGSDADGDEFVDSLRVLGQSIVEQREQGGPVDARAMEPLQRAAAQGYPEAQFILSRVLLGGGPEDATEAGRLLQLAAEQGHTGAQFLLGVCHVRHVPSGMPKDSQLARQWLRPLAAQGHTEAQVVLAGIHVFDKEFAEARVLLHLAVATGHGMAQFLLACLYGTGQGGPEDTTEALRLLSLAGYGEADAWTTLSHIQFREAGVEPPDVGVEPLGGDVEPSPEAEVESLEQREPSALDATAWRCLGCNAINSGNVCTARSGGKPCNSTRATGLAVSSVQRSRGSTQRLPVSGGAGTSYEDAGGASSSSTGANPKVARGGGSKTPVRGKARAGSSAAAAPALAEAGLLEPVNKVTKALLAREEARHELDRMVGIASVKTAISALCNVVIYNEMNRRVGTEPPAATHHMLFLGNPGTGKTTVAKIVSKMLYQIGIVSKDTIKEFDNARTALVDGVVGGTAKLAARVVKSAIGGVLFLDEARRLDWHAAHLHACAARTLTLYLNPIPFTQAYTLIPMVGGADFSQEAIGVLLAKAEEHRKDTVIILAGYSDRMDELLACNPGLTSRFPKRLTFDDYTPAELMAIAKRMAATEFGDVLAEDALALLEDTLLAEPLPANGRDVRNLLERAMEKRATRVVAATRFGTGGEVLASQSPDPTGMRNPALIKVDFQ